MNSTKPFYLNASTSLVIAAEGADESLEIVILTAWGYPVEGAVVRLLRDSRVVAEAVTGPGGRAVIAPLVKGVYVVEAEYRGFTASDVVVVPPTAPKVLRLSKVCFVLLGEPVREDVFLSVALSFVALVGVVLVEAGYRGVFKPVARGIKKLREYFSKGGPGSE